jgi:hypothetical protein
MALVDHDPRAVGQSARLALRGRRDRLELVLGEVEVADEEVGDLLDGLPSGELLQELEAKRGALIGRAVDGVDLTVELEEEGADGLEVVLGSLARQPQELRERAPTLAGQTRQFLQELAVVGVHLVASCPVFGLAAIDPCPVSACCWCGWTIPWSDRAALPRQEQGVRGVTGIHRPISASSCADDPTPATTAGIVE